MERREFLRTTGVATAVGLSGCIGAGGARQEYDIGMGAAIFRPQTIHIKPGTTVVWRNTSKQGHTVTAYGGAIPDSATYFASGGFDTETAAREAWANSTAGTLFQGQIFSQTFDIPGTFPYFCIPHESAGMVGKVVVADDDRSS